MKGRKILKLALVCLVAFNLIFVVSSLNFGLGKSDLCRAATGCPDTDHLLCATIKGSALGFYEVTWYCYQPERTN